MDDKIAIRRRVVMSVGVIALVLVIDQIIKIAVKTHMWVGERISVTDWFQIFFTENKGMAFGLDFFGTFFLALFRLVAVVGFSYLLAKLIWWDTFQLGLAPLVVGMFFFFAVQLFFIGLIGEYLGAVWTQVKNKPLVIEEERINFDK